MLRFLSRSFNSEAMSTKMMLETASLKFKIGKVWTQLFFLFEISNFVVFFLYFCSFLFHVFEWIWNPKLPNIWFWCLDIIDFRSFGSITEAQYFSISFLA